MKNPTTGNDDYREELKERLSELNRDFRLAKRAGQEEEAERIRQAIRGVNDEIKLTNRDRVDKPPPVVTDLNMARFTIRR
jgi:hypothetical protein